MVELPSCSEPQEKRPVQYELGSRVPVILHTCRSGHCPCCDCAYANVRLSIVKAVVSQCRNSCFGENTMRTFRAVDDVLDRQHAIFGHDRRCICARDADDAVLRRLKVHAAMVEERATPRIIRSNSSGCALKCRERMSAFGALHATFPCLSERLAGSLGRWVYLFVSYPPSPSMLQHIWISMLNDCDSANSCKYY